MAISSINEILLMALTEPEYSRVEFWEGQQKESIYSEKVFWQKLNESWQYYSNKIYGKISEKEILGAKITDYALPLLFETNQKLTGHFGIGELITLYDALVEYGIKLKAISYYYQYDSTNIVSTGHNSPFRTFNLIKLINEQHFVSELESKHPNEIPSFIDFHFRYCQRNGGNVNDWISYTKKKLPSKFTLQQRDAFLLWFEEYENRLIGPVAVHDEKPEVTTGKLTFELFNYDLVVSTVVPYFKFLDKGKQYQIYEGAIGVNRFQYFEVNKKSKTGKLCKDLEEKYYVKNERRYNFYDEVNVLIEQAKESANEKLTGLPAYLKYWNDCLSKVDKRNHNIFSILHVDALKEWFSLSIEKHIEENKDHYLEEEIRKADIRRFTNDIIVSVEVLLKSSERGGKLMISNISSFHANELIKFYNWLKENSNDTKQVKDELVSNNPAMRPTITAYAIMHVYLSLFGGKAVTQQNKNELAKSYGYQSGNQLRNDFTFYIAEAKRMDLHTTNKRSANTHLERFRWILPMLREQNSKAFEKASAELRILEHEYRKHY